MEWLKALVPIAVALIALAGTTANRQQATVNCTAIEDIKMAMRSVIVAAPVDPDHPEKSRRFTLKGIGLVDEIEC